LWTKTEAEFHGKYYNFPPVRSYPKPAQKPHPPVLLGGHARGVLRRIAEWGDGWLPNRATPEDVEKSRRQLDALAKEFGRDPKSITISAFGQPPDRELVHRFHDAGVERVIVRPPVARSEQEMGVELERIARAVLR
jgi:alkanesulfonate monooxygenase SsuD/methylene tetrahydromethanopterin reductase-like flavin-dependent oxidoreductase (luciferase family)